VPAGAPDAGSSCTVAQGFPTMGGRPASTNLCDLCGSEARCPSCSMTAHRTSVDARLRSLRCAAHPRTTFILGHGGLTAPLGARRRRPPRLF